MTRPKTPRRLPGVTLALLMLALPARAEDKAYMDVLRIGMVVHPAAGARVAGASEIEASFSRALGLPVQIFVARDYAALIEAQAGGRIDYGLYSAAAYAAAAASCGCVEAIAAPTGADGSTGIRAALLTRRDRGGSTMRVAVVRGATTGWLAAARPSAGDAEGPVVVPAATASEAEEMLVSGAVDAIVGWIPDHASEPAPQGGTLGRLLRAGLAVDALEIGWLSDPLPYGPHAVRPDMPVAIKQALRSHLTRLAETDPAILELLDPERQGPIRAVADGDYAQAQSLVAVVAADGELR